MTPYPRSAYDQTGGVYYFARMLHKIRLFADGQLLPDYHANLGNGFDGRMCRYLKVDYAKVRDQVNGGATDEEVLEWCYANGRRLSELEILVWNGFASKRGWRDHDGGSDFLVKAKESSGLSHLDDIQTLFDYYEYDEKRKP